VLSGYDKFHKDRPVNREGGGILLYVRRELQAFEFVPQTKFPEQFWCQFEDIKCDNFFVGVCYCTPTDTIFDLDTHGVLRELISEMGISGRHFLLKGDINYSYKQ